MNRRRTVPRSRGKPTILVICEGTKTEPDYLKLWGRRYRSSVSIEVQALGADARTVVDRGVEALRLSRRDERRGRGRGYASIWVMFDCDEHPDIKGQVDRALAAGLSVAFSNPCVELWFLLHFQDQTAFIHRNSVQQACDTHLSGGKSLSDNDLTNLQANYQAAKARAQGLGERHLGNGSWKNENPSSTVWELVDAIRS